MRKGLLLPVFQCSSLLAFVATAFAADHPEITSWQATNGKIDYNSMCSAGKFTCSETASGNGFVQLQVTNDVSKSTYIVTVITDPTATGQQADLGFSDQSVVKVNLNNSGLSTTNQNGIIAIQKIQESTASAPNGAGDTFTSLTNIDTATFSSNSGVSSIRLQQSVVTAGSAGSTPITSPTSKDFTSNFWFEKTSDSTGKETGMKLEIDQFAGLEGKVGGPNDVQVFTLREIKGEAALPTAGNVLLPNATKSSTDNANFPSDTTISWTPGQDIKAIWIGQNIELDTSSGGPSRSGFEYLSFENKTDNSYGARSTLEGIPSDQKRQIADWNAAFNVRGQTKAPCWLSASGENC